MKLLRAVDPPDVIGMAGIVLIVYGVSRWSLNTSIVLAGLLLLGVAYRLAKPQKGVKKKHEG
jgi:hypothetical protein